LIKKIEKDIEEEKKERGKRGRKMRVSEAILRLSLIIIIDEIKK
jgi:hypothetical protein